MIIISGLTSEQRDVNRERYYKQADWPLHYRMLDKFDKLTIELLDRVWEVYGKYTKYQLSNMSHGPDSVWKQFVGDALEDIIDECKIRYGCLAQIIYKEEKIRGRQSDLVIYDDI